MKNKKILTIVLEIFFLILLTPIVDANYQMCPNGTRAQVDLNTYMDNMRNMEAEGQVMGLKETHDTTTLKPTTAENGIDVHMQKNTEYGACLILSACPKYGKQGTGSDSYIHTNTSTGIATTTGNQYGVYDIGSNWEWTAGGGESANSTGGYNYAAVPYNPRYFNIYSEQVSKPGDATTETKEWKGALYGNFVASHQAFLRTVFSFSGSPDWQGTWQQYNGRAVAVAGLNRRTLMMFCSLI